MPRSFDLSFFILAYSNPDYIAAALRVPKKSPAICQAFQVEQVIVRF